MKKLPKKLTYGDGLRPAMELRTKTKALEYFEALVQRDMKHFGKTRAEAERGQRSNLAYFAVYYDHETRVRVERLFGGIHPIFGSAASLGEPTPDKAFRLGKKRARKQ